MKHNSVREYIFTSVLTIFVLLCNFLISQEIGSTFIFQGKDHNFYSQEYLFSSTCQYSTENANYFTQDAQINDFTISPYDPSIFIVTTNSGVLVSYDAGISWQPRNGTTGSDALPLRPENNLANIYQIAEQHKEEVYSIAFEDDMTWWVALRGDGDTKTVYRTTNSSETWRRKSTGLPTFNSHNPTANKIFFTQENGYPWAATTGGLFYKDGSRFKNRSGAFPVPEINDWPAIPAYDISLLNDSTLFVATEFGLFSGSVEEQFQDALPIGGGTIDILSTQSDNPTEELTLILNHTTDQGQIIAPGQYINLVDTQFNIYWKGQIALNEPTNEFFITIKNENIYWGSELTDYSLISIEFLTAHSVQDLRITQVTIDNQGTLYCSSSENVFRYNADTNEMENLGFEDSAILSLATSPIHGMIYLGTNNGLYYLNPDSSWELISPSINHINGIDSYPLDVRSIEFDGDRIYFAGHLGGLHYSDNNGETWNNMNYGLTHRSIEMADVETVSQSVEYSTPADETMGIYESVQYHIGDYSDVDENGKVNILFMDILDNCYNSLDDLCYDYYFDDDNITESEIDLPSNNSDVIYIDSDPFLPSESANSISKALGKLAFVSVSVDEDKWFVEGVPEMASYFCGYRSIDEFFQLYHNNSLTFWGDTSRDLEISLSYLTVLYLYEQYFYNDPDVDYLRSFKSLVQNESIGIGAINECLNLASYTDTFADVFNNIAIATLLDQVDDVDFYGGKYRWQNANVTTSFSTYPWPEGVSAAAPYFETINRWAFKINKSLGINPANGNDYSPTLGDVITFQGSDDGDFNVFCIKNEDFYSLSDSAVVSEIDLNLNNAGIIDVTDFGDEDSPFQLVYNIITNHSDEFEDANYIISNSFNDYSLNPWSDEDVHVSHIIDQIGFNITWNDLWLDDQPEDDLNRTSDITNLTYQEFKEWHYSKQQVSENTQRIQDMQGFEGFKVVKEEVYIENSFIEFNETDAVLNHEFYDVPQNGDIVEGKVVVSLAGNYFLENRYAKVYLDSHLVGTATLGYGHPSSDCPSYGGNHDIFEIPLSEDLLNEISSDGEIIVTTENYGGVEAFCEENFVNVDYIFITILKLLLKIILGIKSRIMM